MFVVLGATNTCKLWEGRGAFLDGLELRYTREKKRRRQTSPSARRLTFLARRWWWRVKEEWRQDENESILNFAYTHPNMN